MSFRFEQPLLLLIGLLAVPLVLLAMRALKSMDPLRRRTILTLRTLVLLLVVAMLAGPHAVREHDQVTVIALVDVSGSVRRFAEMPELPDGRRNNVDYLRHWLREAVDLKQHDDRFGIVAFDGEAVAISAPAIGEYVDDNLDMDTLDGTNIAEAIRLGLAMFPGDTARRLVLVTDGNETRGDASEAARQAAGGDRTAASVPIDVLPIEYTVSGDVQVARVETPPTAQPGQTITARVIIEATEPTQGRLTLRREGVPIDLDPDRPGNSRIVTASAGQSVHIAQVVLGENPINRFEASFEPLNAADDALPENNRAEAFTATPSRGTVLIVSSAPDRSTNALAEMLRTADIPASVQPPQAVPDDLLSLQNYELIVLDNVAAYELTGRQHELIAQYVERLGGGLIMSGGNNSFGAGGWTRTDLAQVLPVNLDPPRELRAPPAGLVLVLDRSGSMNRPVGGARASQQEVANEGAALAIESLQRDTFVGVVAFDHIPEQFIPIQRNDNPVDLANRVRTINAVGGTEIQPALQMGYDMLQSVDVQNRHMVLLTDGLSSDPNMEQFIERMAGENVIITTIGVGDQIDREQLRMIADTTGGVFYHVRNPRTLPRVLVDSVQEFNKPLLKEGEFLPQVRSTGSTLTLDMAQAPPLGGLVITAPRESPLVSLEMTHPDGEPLLAHWQVGLGRAAAFTSDLDGRWSQQWADWPGAQAFWMQLVRTISRPAVSRETELTTVIRDGQLHITLEAVGEEEGFLDYLRADGTVYAPDGSAVDVQLRQTAPGRYEAATPAQHSGSYIVAVNPQHGSRQLAPVIGGASLATSEEFRRYTANATLLDTIAETTGGRELDVNNPRAVNLFDRRDMPRSASLLPMWRPLLWLTLVLLLLDIACRRIAWNQAMLRNGLAAALAKVTPARLRGGQAAATLSGLRTASTRADTRRARQAGDVSKLSATGDTTPRMPQPRPAPTSTQAQAEKIAPTQQVKKKDPSRVSAALDAMQGRKQPPKKEESPKREQGDQPAARDDNGESKGDTRNSLLAAKRRAQQKHREDRDT